MEAHGFGYNGNLNYYLFFGGIITLAAFLFTIFFCLKKKKDGIPGGMQNIAEAIVEFLINMIEPVLGDKLVPIALPFLGTFFIYILLSNYLLILPHPFANPPTGDISVTLALAFICVFGLQIYSFFIINGPKKAIMMWLNPVPGLTGEEEGHGENGHKKKKTKKSRNLKESLLEFMKKLPLKILILVFIVLKVVDNAARLLSLSLRLFGNIYGEHTILATTTEMAIARPALILTLFIPFLILSFDILVALIQAVVFTNLSLFYMKEEWGVHD